MSFGLRLAALLGLALACLLAALLALCWLLAAGFGGMFLAGGASAGMHPRGWRIALAFDQLANVVAGGFEDETISSRAWRMAQGGSRKWALLRRAIDALFWFDPDHCRTSFFNEHARLVSLINRYRQAAPAEKGGA